MSQMLNSYWLRSGFESTNISQHRAIPKEKVFEEILPRKFYFSHVVTSTSVIMGKASLVVVVLVAMLCANQAHAQGWEALVPQVVGKLISLWRSGSVELFGQECSYSQRPSFSRWRLKWKNYFQCPGLGDVRGYCKTSSRSKGINCAVTDFVKQAINKRLMTAKQAATWLGQKSG
ncbi:Anti-lipopolysaccharide factor/Scygonadin [Trinorchestia longiramus]|nr:Anti-lipopolysaccharide factor/Scygonadin [Trinorchestia longiramus]